MPDPITSRGHADRLRINIHEEFEARYWTRILGVSREELREAIDAVGDSVYEVAEHLLGGETLSYAQAGPRGHARDRGETHH